MSSANVQQFIRQSGLRPTRQRLMIGTLLWGGKWTNKTRHVTAEKLHKECQREGFQVSLATVYNTLHHFVESGLLKEVRTDKSSSLFDTNVLHHHHFLCESTGELTDIPEELVSVDRFPEPKEGYGVQKIDVIIRVKEEAEIDA